MASMRSMCTTALIRNPFVEEDENPGERCATCGEGPIGDAHTCDICNKPNHPFCGIQIDGEGYGQTVRCRTCPLPAGFSAGALTAVQPCLISWA